MKIVLVVVLGALPFGLGGNFTCYHCGGCQDPFNAEAAKIETCTSACVKAVIMANNGTVATVRSCREIFEPKENISSSGLPTDVAQVHYYQCGENLCNNAYSPVAPASLVFTTFIAILIPVNGVNRHLL